MGKTAQTVVVGDANPRTRQLDQPLLRQLTQGARHHLAHAADLVGDLLVGHRDTLETGIGAFDQKFGHAPIQAVKRKPFDPLHQVGKPVGQHREQEMAESRRLRDHPLEQFGRQDRQLQRTFGHALGGVIGIAQQTAGGEDAGLAATDPIQHDLAPGLGAFEHFDAALQHQRQTAAVLALAENPAAVAERMHHCLRQHRVLQMRRKFSQ